MEVAFVALVHAVVLSFVVAVVFVALKIIITGGGSIHGLGGGCLRRRGSALVIASVLRAAAMLLFSSVDCSHMAGVFSSRASVPAKIVKNTPDVLVGEALLDSARRIGRALARLAPLHSLEAHQLHEMGDTGTGGIFTYLRATID